MKPTPQISATSTRNAVPRPGNSSKRWYNTPRPASPRPQTKSSFTEGLKTTGSIAKDVLIDPVVDKAKALKKALSNKVESTNNTAQATSASTTPRRADGSIPTERQIREREDQKAANAARRQRNQEKQEAENKAKQPTNTQIYEWYQLQNATKTPLKIEKAPIRPPKATSTPTVVSNTPNMRSNQISKLARAIRNSKYKGGGKSW